MNRPEIAARTFRGSPRFVSPFPGPRPVPGLRPGRRRRELSPYGRPTRCRAGERLLSSSGVGVRDTAVAHEWVLLMSTYWPSLYRRLHRLPVEYTLGPLPNDEITDSFGRECRGATQFTNGRSIETRFNPALPSLPAPDIATSLAHEGLHALFGGLAVLRGQPSVGASLLMPASKADRFIYYHPISNRPPEYGRRLRDWYLGHESTWEAATGHAGLELLVNCMLVRNGWSLSIRQEARR